MNLFDKTLHYLGRSKTPTTFVQIGAMDGMSFDESVGYIEMYGWTGLFVEPTPTQFERLKKNRGRSGNKFEQAAIVQSDGPIEMVEIDPIAVDTGKVHPCFGGMSAVWPPKNGLKQDGDREVLEKYGRKIVVSGLTLATLFAKHDIASFDLFLVDAEGFDAVILDQLDLNRYQPKLIRIERVNLSDADLSRYRSSLQQHGYVTEDAGQNLDAVLKAVWEKIADTLTTPVLAQSKSMMPNTTLVTALFDLRRGDLNSSFKRPYSQYLENFGKLLKACKDIPMLVYVDQTDADFVRASRIGSVGTDIRIKKADDFKTWFAFYDKVQSIRRDPNWFNQSGWLKDSTQAKLDLYNPLVMSKMFLLNDAAIFNPFGTDNFCWIDAGLTQTVHAGYFSTDHVIEKLEPLLDKFLFVCYPYGDAPEIHGFERKAIARYAGVNHVDRVARGGFFGGHRNVLRDISAAYYNILQSSLNEGLMGTEESIFSILTYTNKDRIRVEMIESNGLMGTFFEHVKQMPIPKRDVTLLKSSVPENVAYHQTESEVDLNRRGSGTALYIVTFNFPKQLKLLLDTFSLSNPEILNVKRKVLIDNSTDVSTSVDYDKLANEYGFVIVRKGNLGICGARQWAADDFHNSDERYMLWFEDDMLLVPKKGAAVCKNGLNTHVDGWLDKCIRIVEQEKLDFLKLSFSEFYGDHHEQWAWHNVPAHVKMKYFPDGTHRMKWDVSGCQEGLSYGIGEIFYSNWPSCMTKRGNYKIFLEEKYEHPYEQTWMSRAFQLQKKGELRGAVLLASLINHNRVFHYSKEIRKEC